MLQAALKTGSDCIRLFPSHSVVVIGNAWGIEAWIVIRLLL